VPSTFGSTVTNEKLFNIKNYYLNVDSLEISKLDIVRFIKNAFPNAFDEITVLAKENSFEIIGVDKSSTIACDLTLDMDAFSDYNISTKYTIPIISEKLRQYLGLSLSTYISDPEGVKTAMVFSSKAIDLTICDEKKYIIRRQLRLVPTGMIALPLLPDFSNVPSCDISIDPKRLGFVFASSKDIESLDVFINGNGITFESAEYNNPGTMNIGGSSKGSAKSALLNASLGVVSSVCELACVTGLKIYVINKGQIKFSYKIEGGILNYFVTPLV